MAWLTTTVGEILNLKLAKTRVKPCQVRHYKSENTIYCSQLLILFGYLWWNVKTKKCAHNSLSLARTKRNFCSLTGGFFCYTGATTYWFQLYTAVRGIISTETIKRSLIKTHVIDDSKGILTRPSLMQSRNNKSEFFSPGKLSASWQIKIKAAFTLLKVLIGSIPLLFQLDNNKTC